MIRRCQLSHPYRVSHQSLYSIFLSSSLHSATYLKTNVSLLKIKYEGNLKIKKKKNNLFPKMKFLQLQNNLYNKQSNSNSLVESKQKAKS